MKKAMIIVNPSSGKEEAEKNQHRVEEVLRNKGYDVIVKMTKKQLDATKFARTSCEDAYDLVVSMGGDGTLNETVNGLANQEHCPRFGIIPTGTVNDFARALNIPLDFEEALSLIEQGDTRPVDIGKVNDQYFMNIAAVGAIAEATYEVSPKQKTMLGPLAYMLEGLKTLSSKKSYNIQLKHDQGEWEGEALLVLAALTNSVGGFEKVAPDAEVDDGKLKCLVVHDVALPKFIKIVTELLGGKHVDDENVEYISTSKLEISSSEKLHSNIDGDEGDTLPLNIEILPRHLDIYVP
ncbi:diacylglycerol/lipid kinase family protein [Pseudalkalibacillus berkeleyi]|uniref:YegS/Rv2252/BmrU family lipid kinase n=1 Tax=Pseudalkalibacillus berkeleyi TaxID=1069813 RepID=A0ABS9H425_9BACL|nr:YegS/Rv2252/BmrU family lipid kinase [Pseudalkalibacillus berkeleyi]MCF6138856.1 YegS/Rv2252/BmrU family lipid kinase [Pseudalkalibacillus berkeleyi]